MKKINILMITIGFLILNSSFIKADTLNELKPQIKEAYDQANYQNHESEIIKLVESWIKLGGSTNMDPNDDSWSLLVKAAALGYLNLSKFLIDHQARINNVTLHGLSPLMIASNNNLYC